jgi:cytochrome c biogenesis factor
MQNCLLDPVNKIVEEDVKGIKKQSKKFDKHTALYEKVENRISNKKNSKKSHIELLSHKSKMQIQELALIFKLNSWQQKTRVQFLDGIANFMEYTYTYLKQSFELMNSKEGLISSIKANKATVS